MFYVSLFFYLSAKYQPIAKPATAPIAIPGAPKNDPNLAPVAIAMHIPAPAPITNPVPIIVLDNET